MNPGAWSKFHPPNSNDQVWELASHNAIVEKSILGNAKKSQMPKRSESRSWIDLLSELVELFFKSMRQSKQGRSWNQHVVPYEGIWAVRREGNERITSKHRTQEAAIRKAKRLARKHKADVIIHRQDGSIRDRVPSG